MSKPETKPCDYCGTAFIQKRPNQRFCPAPKTCRQNWHKRNGNLPGVVKGIRAVQKGWSVTIHFPTQPSIQMGTSVRIETTPEPRRDASQKDNG